MPFLPHERRQRPTQFTKREVLAIVNDPTNNPYDGGLHYPSPESARLAKEKKLKISVSGGFALEYEFLDAHTLRWNNRGVWQEERYEAYEPAKDVIFFFHLQKGSVPPKATAACVDFASGLVTVNQAQIGNENYTPRDVSSRILFGAIEKDGAVAPGSHSFTDDFVGKAAAWRVGHDWLTHHYINPRFFLNEILTPDGEIYLTIAEPAQYVKVRENVYVFSWREMAGPGLMGMDVMNWETMTSSGFFYGISEDDRLECYAFSRSAGKWLSVADRKKMHKKGMSAVLDTE
jgi:hypothetical protein